MVKRPKKITPKKVYELLQKGWEKFGYCKGHYFKTDSGGSNALSSALMPEIKCVCALGNLTLMLGFERAGVTEKYLRERGIDVLAMIYASDSAGSKELALARIKKELHI